jgi:hypothetical protein
VRHRYRNVLFGVFQGNGWLMRYEIHRARAIMTAVPETT